MLIYASVYAKCDVNNMHDVNTPPSEHWLNSVLHDAFLITKQILGLGHFYRVTLC